jgi:hypothetical protein
VSQRIWSDAHEAFGILAAKVGVVDRIRALVGSSNAPKRWLIRTRKVRAAGVNAHSRPTRNVEDEVPVISV